MGDADSTPWDARDQRTVDQRYASFTVSGRRFSGVAVPFRQTASAPSAPHTDAQVWASSDVLRSLAWTGISSSLVSSACLEAAGYARASDPGCWPQIAAPPLTFSEL